MDSMDLLGSIAIFHVRLESIYGEMEWVTFWAEPYASILAIYYQLHFIQGHQLHAN